VYCRLGRFASSHCVHEREGGTFLARRFEGRGRRRGCSPSGNEGTLTRRTGGTGSKDTASGDRRPPGACPVSGAPLFSALTRHPADPVEFSDWNAEGTGGGNREASACSRSGRLFLLQSLSSPRPRSRSALRQAIFSWVSGVIQPCSRASRNQPTIGNSCGTLAMSVPNRSRSWNSWRKA